MSYRVEVSGTSRAGCKNKECKDAGIKIFKGQLRFGTYVTMRDYQSWVWKHWGCVTPKQIMNVKSAVDDDADNLDGYDELPKDLQDKIKLAFEEGHVADEDWGGDIEMNRPGKNGFRTPETKKARKAEAQGNTEGTASSSHSPVKKRGHVKDDVEAVKAEDDGPPLKKKKTAIKKEKKVKKEEPETTSGDEPQPIKRGRKKATNVKIKAEPSNEGVEGNGEAPSPPPARRTRLPRKAAAAKKIKEEDVLTDASEQSSDESKRLPVKKSRAPRKATNKRKIKEEETIDDYSEDHNSDVPVKKTRAPRKTAAAKKAEVEEDDNVLANLPTSKASVATKKTKVSRAKPTGKIIKEEPEEDALGLTDANAKPDEEASETSDKVKLEGGAGSESDAKTEAKKSEAMNKATKSGRKTTKRTTKAKAPTKTPNSNGQPQTQ